MKLQKTNLLALSKKASRAIRPSLLAIRQCIKIEADGKTLSVSGMSNEMTIRAWMECEDENITTPFVCVVNAKLFVDILSALVSDEVELTLQADEVTIHGGRTTLDVKTFDEASWAELPEFHPEASLKLDPESILACAHALAKDKARGPIMDCFHIEVMEEGYRVTALDGFRIAQRMKNPAGAVIHDFIVNGEFLKEAIKLAGEEPLLETDDEKVRVTGPGVEISGQMTTGTYFNIDSLLSSKPKKAFKVDRKEFLDAINVASIMDNTLVFDMSKTNIKVSSRRDNGKTNAEIPVLDAVVDADQSVRIAFEANFLTEALQSIPDEEILLELLDAIHPVTIKNQSYLELVLPKKIK